MSRIIQIFFMLQGSLHLEKKFFKLGETYLTTHVKKENEMHKKYASQKSKQNMAYGQLIKDGQQ